VRPVWAAVAATAVGVLAVAGMRVLAGVELRWAILLGVPVVACTLLFLLTPAAAEAVWAPLPEPAARPTEHLAAAFASRLGEAAEHPARFRTRVQPRLARLALVKLRRAGVDDLHDPRASEVLGERLHRLVTNPNATMPDPHEAAALFATLDEP
jgi:hypothetical protein